MKSSEKRLSTKELGVLDLRIENKIELVPDCQFGYRSIFNLVRQLTSSED